MHLALYKTAFKPVKTLQPTLMKVKTCVPEEKRKEFVYELPCKGKFYVEETKRTQRAQVSSEEM